MLRASMDELMATESDTESEKSKRAVVKAKKQTLNVQSFARRPRIQSYQGPSPAERSPIKRSFAKRKGNPNAKSQEQGMEVLDDSSRMEAQLSPYEPNLVLTRGILI